MPSLSLNESGKALKQYIETQGQREIRVNVSIGVATSQSLNESELELEQLLALADKDMYKQKIPSD